MSQQQHLQHHHQHIQHHPQQPTHYVHYNPVHIQQQPQPQQQQQQQQQHPHQQVVTHIAPKDTQHAQQPQASSSGTSTQPQGQAQQPQGSGSTTSAPLVARGDWTKDLVHLAKTAELKKHALTLQLHTAHILSAHATLEQKGKTIQDLREQKNKLESERCRLLNSLREINEDRDKVDLLESTLDKECRETRAKIAQLTETEYAIAKADVDRLRTELGQPPLPSVQSTLDERTSQYLNERRLTGNDTQTQPYSASGSSSALGAGVSRNSNAVAGPSSLPSNIPPSNTTTNASHKRTSSPGAQGGGAAKRPRGRPKGSKNKKSGVDD